MIPVIVLIILSLDQLTKFLVNKSLSLNQSLPVIRGVLNITLVHNKGAAFGLLKDQLPLFIIVSIFAVLLIVLNLKGHKGINLYSLSLTLILSGALGNLIDRALFGYVIDFLDFRIWPVFNVADSAITIGAILLAYDILVPKRKTDS